MAKIEIFDPNSIVICDSVEEISKILNSKNQHIKIYASSPAVFLKFKDVSNILYLEEKWDVENTRIFQKDINLISSKIIDLFKNEKNFDKEDILAICQFTWLFQRSIYKYSCIKDNFLNRKIYYIKFKPKINLFSKHINFNWKLLFDKKINYEEVVINFDDSNWHNFNLAKIGYFKRLKIAGFESVIYRLILKLCKFISKFYKFKKNLFIISDNPLIIQNSIKFFLNGFRLIVIKDNKKLKKNNNNNRKVIFPKNLFDLINLHINKYAEPSVSKLILNVYREELIKYYDEHLNKYEYYKKYLEKNNSKNNLIFNGTVSGLFINALSKAAYKLKIPFFSFQHGVTLEIVDQNNESLIRHEALNSNVFFCYNQGAREVVNQLEFQPDKTIIIGSSKRHGRVEQNKIKFLEKKILYISTNLYKGNLGSFSSCVNDLNQCKDEIYILEKILSKIKFNVTYKTYPEINRRYIDIDPAILKCKELNNLDIIEEKIDLRYIVNSFNILISSGATSTLGWLMMSNLPIIFINNSNRLPLKTELINSFKESIFYFELEEKNIVQNINNMLSLSRTDLLDLWNSKKVKRDILLKEYFSDESSVNLYDIALRNNKI